MTEKKTTKKIKVVDKKEKPITGAVATPKVPTKQRSKSKTKAITKSKPKKPPAKRRSRAPRTYRAKVEKIFKEVLPLVTKDVDFAIIPINKAKTKFSVEPTRDLNLMLIDYFKISYDTDLQKVESRGEDETLYTVKAQVWDNKGNKASGLGMASTKESYTYARWQHDALAKAETRALKRGVEARCGFPIINKMILHFFGGFVLDKNLNPIDVPQIENGAGMQTEQQTRRPPKAVDMPKDAMVQIESILREMKWLPPDTVERYRNQAASFINKGDLKSLTGLAQNLTRQITIRESKKSTNIHP